MSVAHFTAVDAGQPAASRLSKTYRRAMAFQPEHAASLMIEPDAMRDLAEMEAAGGPIMLDAQGLTAGICNHVVQPARELLAQWHGVRHEFEAALAPKRAAIDAADHLDASINALRVSARDELAKVVDTWRLFERNKVIQRDWKAARSAYAAGSDRNGGRVVNRLAHLPVYWAALLLFAVADALLNRGAFLSFTGQPLIATGAALAVGLLLALAGHCHGMLAKQWPLRLTEDAAKRFRWNSWGLAALGTGAAAAAMSVVAGVACRSPLDAPMRWAAMAPSVFANAFIWGLCTWLARACHDRDPQFMAASRRYRRAGRRYRSARSAVNRETKKLEERYTREIMAMQVETMAKAALVVLERGKLAHVQAREAAIVGAVITVTQANIEQYRQVLSHYVARAHYDAKKLGGQPRTSLFRRSTAGLEEVSAYCWLSMALRIDAWLLSGPATAP